MANYSDFKSAALIVDGAITKEDLDRASADGTGAVVLPVGTTAQRPASPEEGMFRYNTELSTIEQYTSVGWSAIASPPVIASTDVTNITETGSATLQITVSGSFFGAGAVVSFIGSDSSGFNATTTSFINANTLVATVNRSSFSNALEPYDIVVTNPSGLTYKLENQINVNASPVWSTSSGSLGTIEGYDTASTLSTSTLVATDPESGAVTYTVTTGSLPGGLTLGSNGVISGTATNPASSTTYSFTVRATDSTNNTDRSFTITVTSLPNFDGVGRIIRPASWNTAGAGVVASVSALNDLRVDTHASWSNDSASSQTTASSIIGISSEFARHVTYYRATALESSGCVVFSGHGNTSDPLPAKDVAFYYSNDTTNGTDGTWTRITPTGMVVSRAAKHSSSASYVGQRSSVVSGDHVVLSGNVQDVGISNSGNNVSYAYNRTGEMGDLIFWNPISAKGWRMDVRTKWANGAYASEKPHISMWALFDNGQTIPTKGLSNLEDDANTLLYIDPAVGRSYSGSGTALNDLSANNFDYDFSSMVLNGSVSHSTNNGGSLVFNQASMRKSGLRPSVTTAFTFGGWVKFGSYQASSGAGILSYGSADPTNKKRFFVRTYFGGGGQYGMFIGSDVAGADRWIPPPGRNSNNTSSYIQSISNYATKYHFVVFRVSTGGFVDYSLNGDHFIPVFSNNNDQAIASLSSGDAVFYLGSDGHNDNWASHSYGPFFFYNGGLSYGQVVKEWDRYKTRFGW